MFPWSQFGLRIHDELTVDPSLTKNVKLNLNLAKMELSPSTAAASLEILKEKHDLEKPGLVILFRSGSREHLIKD